MLETDLFIAQYVIYEQRSSREAPTRRQPLARQEWTGRRSGGLALRLTEVDAALDPLRDAIDTSSDFRRPDFLRQDIGPCGSLDSRLQRFGNTAGLPGWQRCTLW
ncbi:hypothetical protein GCM10010502_68500 [Kitasatospora aureofaciens]|uniref:Uncharacterized protein n=1 Tax=Kitasatospora aureofaciens TaxID=1894 RepID=A0A8H9I1G4_KITAU|nr:hypothetical protein GCM10010502_68500 [Kitasatospora aureofaciens]